MTHEQDCDSILSIVRRKFLTDCQAHEVPNNQQLSVLHVMFREESLRYFTDQVLPASTNMDDAFTKAEEHFMTAALKDAYTTEWNTLSIREIRQKHSDKTTSEVFHCLFQRARDLQSLLDKAYQSPILLRDCIIEAVKIE